MIIPGYSCYNITEDGVITEIATSKVLPQYICRVNTGYTYKRVCLVDDSGKKRQIPVVKLLAISFLGIPERPSIARAKDGDNTNAVLSNVEWIPLGSHYSLYGSRKVTDARKRKTACYNEDSIALVYDTLKEIGQPRTTSALSRILEVPYSTVRYSVYALIERGKAKRTKDGVEAL